MLSLRCACSRSSGAQASCAQLRTSAALGAGTTSASSASLGTPGMPIQHTEDVGFTPWRAKYPSEKAHSEGVGLLHARLSAAAVCLPGAV